MSVLTPSGGLVYHLRAWRHRAGLWAPFREAVESWLGNVLVGPGELVLVGPSGGHCLPLSVLRRFDRLLVLEPDPMARWLLRRRLTGAAMEVEARDMLVAPLLDGSRGLVELLAARPKASVLFCNLLGQLHFSLSDVEHAQLLRAFRERLLPALEGRAWASFHDRWSLDRNGSEPAPRMRTFAVLPSNDELGTTWFGAHGAPVPVLDHGTSELFPREWPRSYFSWQITPAALHVVEGVARR